MSNPSGLPDDATLAERQAEYEAKRAAHTERVERIVQAFTKLPTAPGRGEARKDPETGAAQEREQIDLAEYLRRKFEDPSTATFQVPVELTIGELEAISRRIAELNSAVMAGSLVNEEAVSRAQVAEVEAAAAVRAAQPKQRPHSEGERTERREAALSERQLRNRERGPDVDSPL